MNCKAKRGCLDLLGEVDKLVHLFLDIPGSSATAERSFSTTRRLKTYLRTTMTATRSIQLYSCTHQGIAPMTCRQKICFGRC